MNENGLAFFADVLEGQKTGWFYDQRDSRAFVARLARGASLLDAYCYTGGFAVAAAVAGAAPVIGIDSSEPALGLARRAAEANGVAERCDFRRAEVFTELDRLGRTGSAVRRGRGRSSGFREVKEGPRLGPAWLPEAGEAGGDAGGTRRFSVHRVVFPQCRAFGIAGGSGAWRSRGGTIGADRPGSEGGGRSSGAHPPAGDGVPEIGSVAA